MVAFTVLFPLAKAIHWLRAASGSALLVSIGVWTAVTVVSRVSADGVGPTLLVGVLFIIVEATRVLSPISNTINRLAAARLCAFFLLMTMWTLLSVLFSFNLHRVFPALETFVTLFLVHAGAVGFPLTITINGLTATTLGALLQLVLVWASKAIVQGNLAHTVHTAALVLVVLVVLGASIVSAPRSNTVHRLGTTIVGALLEVVGVWASMSVIICMKGDLVDPAFPVAVRILIMATESILIPSANTVHRLRAA